MKMIYGRRGITLAYAMVMMVALAAFVSLAVDFGRVQMAKTELQRAADAAARYAAAGLATGVAAAQANAVAAAADNTVDGSPVILDVNQDIEFGVWDSLTRTFTPLSGPQWSNANAVRVTARRVTARGNAVPLLFASMFGQESCNVTASSTAAIRSTSRLYAFAAREQIVISGNGDTDSYNSAAGPYSPSTAGSKGDIASNGDIRLSGRSRIRGGAHAGPDGTLYRGNNVEITGSTANLDSEMNLPDVDASPYAVNNDNSRIPSSFIQSGSLRLSGNQTLNLPAGVYYFSGVSVSGNATLNITGPVTLYVTGDITMSGRANTSQNRPGNFRIRVQGNGNVRISGNSNLYADIYAPGGDVTLSGNGDLFGAVAARNFRVSGNGSLHYDESLETDPSANPDGAIAICTVQ